MAENCKLCEWSIASGEEGPCISMEVTDDAEKCPDFAPISACPPSRCAVCGGVLEKVLLCGYYDAVWRVYLNESSIGAVAVCASCGTLKVITC